MRTHLKFADILDRVESELRSEACRALSRSEAVEAAVDAVVRWVDENTNTGVLEPIDGPALRFFLRLIADWAFDRVNVCEA